MHDKVHTIDSAARRLGLDREYLRSLVKQRSGPSFFRPSRKKTLFLEADLDAWRESWLHVTPQTR